MTRSVGAEGAALVTAVLLSLAALLGAHALLVLARAELAAAAAHRDLFLLESARDRLVDGWFSAADGDSVRLPEALQVGDSVRLDSIGLESAVVARLAARRLAADVWWMSATSSVGSMGEGIGFAVRQMDVDSVLHDVRSAIEAGGPAGALPTASSAVCPGPSTTPVAPVIGAPPRARYSLAPSFVDVWAGVLPSAPDSVGRLDAASAPCGTGWSWGDPADMVCPAEAVGRHMSGSLRLTGGEGIAVVLAEGDVELRGTTLYGVVVTGGAMRLTEGARFVGLARVGGRVEVSADSGVMGSTCWARRALTSSGVTRPHRIPGVARIPPS